MRRTVSELAELVGGVAHGALDRVLEAALPLHQAKPSAVSFVNHLPLPSQSVAGVLLVPRGADASSIVSAWIEVDQPLAAMLKIAALFHPQPVAPATGVHPTAVLHPSVQLGEGCSVGPYAVIEENVALGAGSIVRAHAVIRAGCCLGNRVEIHPHVVLYPFTIVEDDAILHSGVVLGCDGFGYQQTPEGHRKVPQLGLVHVHADVEIGANTTIDRATFGETVIGRGTKIDNQVMIGHNCEIGPHNILAGHVGIAGSSTTGSHVVMAGKVGIGDHVRVGDQAVLLAMTAAHADLPGKEKYLGIPARPYHEQIRTVAIVHRLTEIDKHVRQIRRHLQLADNDAGKGDTRRAS